MNPSDKCRVDGCDRRAAAAIVQDSLPGPLPLCATHTEDFRMNSAGWTVKWERTLAEPTSVQAAPPTAVGRSAPNPAGVAWPHNTPGGRIRTRLTAWRNPRS
jgi:hypothetical protein